MALSVAAAFVVKPRWSAESLLLIQTSRESLGATDISGSGPTVVSIEMPKVVQSEVDIILSDAVLRRAIAADTNHLIFPQNQERRLFGLLPPAEDSVALAAQRLRRAVLVISSATSNLLRVSVALPERSQSVAALRGIVAAYMAQREQVFRQSDAQLLAAERARMEADLRSLDEQVAKLRADNRILDLPQDIQIANNRIADIRGRIDTLRERKASTDARLVAAKTLSETLPSRVVATSETTNLAPNDDSRNELTRLTLERRRMAEQYTANWPPLAELDRRIATLQQSINANRNNRFDTVRQVRNPAIEQLSLSIATLQVESESTGKQMAELQEQATEAQARAGQLLTAENQLRDLGRRRDVLETSFRQVAARESGARISEDAQRSRSPSVVVAQEPEAAAQARDLRPAIVVAGFFGAVVAAIAATILFTLFRRSFATTDEAMRGLGLPGLASLPPRRRRGPDTGAAAVTDLVAMLLDARASGERLSTIQFVATDSKDLRGAIARATAVEMAQNHGLRTLLIDFESDGRTHLQATGSSTESLKADGQVTEPGGLAFTDTAIPNLRVALHAKESCLANPHESLSRSVALLDKLRQETDIVIIAAPSDGEAYAMKRLTSLVDANLLVLRADRTAKGVARTVRDSVLAAGGKLVGFVMSDERRVLPKSLARAVVR